MASLAYREWADRRSWRRISASKAALTMTTHCLSIQREPCWRQVATRALRCQGYAVRPKRRLGPCKDCSSGSVKKESIYINLQGFYIKVAIFYAQESKAWN